MTSYKQQIIDIINNDKHKKTLNIEMPRGNLFTTFLKKYTECCIDNPNKDNNRDFKQLYEEINDCIKIRNYRNDFKITWQKDLDEVIKFTNEYKRSVFNYTGSYKQTVNKKLNKSIEDYNFNLQKTIINEIEKDYLFQKNLSVIKKDSVRKPTYRQKTNSEVLLKLYKQYKKELETIIKDEYDFNLFN